MFSFLSTTDSFIGSSVVTHLDLPELGYLTLYFTFFRIIDNGVCNDMMADNRYLTAGLPNAWLTFGLMTVHTWRIWDRFSMSGVVCAFWP